MCESLYGCEKFIDHCSNILPGKKKYLLLETTHGIEIAKDIVKHFSVAIDGIIIGRGDLSRSISFKTGQSISVHDPIIYDQILDVFNFTKNFDSSLVTALGGGIDKSTIEYISGAQFDCIDLVETRKVVLNKSRVTNKSIDSALRFEMNYLKSQSQLHGAKSAEANARILKIASRLES